MKTLIPALLISTAFSGAALAEDLRATALEQFKPLPSTVPNVADNPTSPAKVELGRALFFDPRLSASGVFSCYSCHNLTTGGDDNLETSIGHGWQKGPRNSPTVLNSVLNEEQFWDGREPDLKAQAKGPVQNPVEMANTAENVEATLVSMPGYVSMFGAAFGNETNPVTFDNMARAIESFEATLITPSPFDAYLNGDDTALNDEEKAGLSLFMDKGCASCHNGVNLGGNGYFAFGAVEKPREGILSDADKGRFNVTGNPEDEYVFRTAPLRNVSVTAPYFHSGKVWDLKDAVQIMAQSQLGETLSDTESEQIVAFLGALEGTVPPVVLPTLPAETASTPRPTTEME